jgi:hypothetical protein
LRDRLARSVGTGRFGDRRSPLCIQLRLSRASSELGGAVAVGIFGLGGRQRIGVLSAQHT